MNNEIKITDFTGVETEFEFCAKVDNCWEEFKCNVDYTIEYDRFVSEFHLKLKDATVYIYDSVIEDWAFYQVSKDELTNLETWMQECVNWDEYYCV